MADEVKTPVYFGVSLEMFRKLTQVAKRTKGSRSSVAGEAVRAYLAAPFPVRGYRLERGTQFRRIATFLTAQEHAQLRELAEQFSTDEEPVSIGTIIREAVRRYLDDRLPPPPSEAPPGPVVTTVPVDQAKLPVEEGVLSADGPSPRKRRASSKPKRASTKRGNSDAAKRRSDEG